MAVLVAFPLLLLAGDLPSWMLSGTTTGFDGLFAALWVIGCACAIGAAWMAKFNPLVALVMVGGTGIVTAMTFLWLSAPDLALTQLMVETVTVVLILLGLRWLPPRSKEAGVPLTLGARLWRTRDAII